MNNRLRHSLKTYTVKDCDPEFVSKKYDKVCNFHYFRDNYLYRKQQGKSVSNHDDLNKENIDDLNESKSDFEVKETLKRKRDTEPFIPVKKQSKNQEEEN